MQTSPKVVEESEADVGEVQGSFESIGVPAYHG
jgi:hypothetical protein